MEVLTILLSSVLGLLTPVGLILDRTAENAIRSRFQAVEQLQVRIDNAPSYQILQGKVDRVQIAGRGLFLNKDLRLAALEIETDPIDLDPASVGQAQPKLNRPLQAGVRLILQQADINQALRSPAFMAQLRDITLNLPGFQGSQQAQRYDFLNPQVQLLDQQRARLQVDLKEQGYPDQLRITVESGLRVVSGQRFELVEPTIQVNGQAAPPELVNALTESISNRFNLRDLEKSGITARVLGLNITPSEQVDISVFVRSF